MIRIMIRSRLIAFRSVLMIFLAVAVLLAVSFFPDIISIAGSRNKKYPSASGYSKQHRYSQKNHQN